MEKIAHKIEEKERTSDIKLKVKVPFSKMLLSDSVRKGINQAGFVYPTIIQANAIPLGKSGIDLLIQSKSGTGKTLIFATILLEAYRNDVREPQSLILAPTREIAVQIESILNEIGKFCQLFKAVCVIGGLDVTDDRKKIQSAKSIVGTPGRVLHLIKNEVLNTSKIRLLILDEADKLMSETFREDLEKIMKSLSYKKQIIACSATFCNDLDNELAKYMRNPLLISTEKRATLLIGIKQFIYEIPESLNNAKEMNEKILALNKIFTKISFKQCLAFSQSQSRSESYRNMLQKNDWPCEAISGAQDQKTRLEIFKKFREFKTRIIFATDLMSRGVDSENVNLVVNLEIPDDGPTYLHRIGRAGRFGSHGIAITFISSKKDKLKFSKILNEIGDNMAVLKFPKGDDIPDLWNFSNLNEEQKAFGLFEKIFKDDEVKEESKEKIKKQSEKNDDNLEKNQNISANEINENLKVPTDTLSSSSNKQHSVNVTTLDDASSLAVDSDIHLDVPNTSSNVPEKKSSPSKSKRSKSREKKKKTNQEVRYEAVVDIHLEEERQQQKSSKKSSSNKLKSEKSKRNSENKENLHLENCNENLKDDSNNEAQSDGGNSSGGDTRTIIDFKSLVVDKNKIITPKTPTNDIFADYETFKEKRSESESKNSVSLEKKPEIPKPKQNNIFDDYDEFKENEHLPNENNIEHTVEIPQLISDSMSNQSESIPQGFDTVNDEKSIILSPIMPKVPNPSPKELKPESFKELEHFDHIDFNKLQVQNLPSFDLPPRNNHSELDTEQEDEDNYVSTSTFSEAVTRSSGFDEKTTSLGSSGIVTSTEYSEESDGSYDEMYAEEEEEYEYDDDDEDENDEDDEEYYETEDETEEDSSSSIVLRQQYSTYREGEEDKEGAKAAFSAGAKESSSGATNNVTENSYNINDQYQQAYATWTNIYWNQYTQIRDYVRFCKFATENAHKM